MKKLMVILFSSLFILAACGSGSKSEKNGDTKEVEKATVAIFVPSEYVNEDQTVEEWDPTLYTKKTVKDNGTTFHMTTAQYEDLKKDTEANLKAMITQVEKSSKFKAVQKIEVMNDYQNLRIDVNRKEYKKSNRDELFQTIGLPIIHYFILMKKEVDTFVIESVVTDVDTSEPIEVINLPMDLSNGVLN